MIAADTLELLKQLFGLLAALVTCIVAILGWLKSRRAAASAADSAFFSRQAADQSGGAAINTGITNDVIAEFKDRFDDVYGALIEERLQEKRIRTVEDQLDVLPRILEFMADLEQERHQQDQAAITGNHLFTEQEHHS